MSIYYIKNGEKKKYNINASDVQLLDIDGKFTSKNLEDAMKEIGSGTETNIQKIEDEITKARNGSNDLNSRLDDIDTKVEANSTQLSENTQNIADLQNKKANVERGTFIPTMHGDNNNEVVYSSRDGFYTKIDNLVFIKLNIQWSSYNSTGIMKINGLPFSASQNCILNLLTASIGVGNSKYLIARIEGDTIYCTGQDGFNNSTFGEYIANSGWLDVSGFYIVSEN